MVEEDFPEDILNAEPPKSLRKTLESMLGLRSVTSAVFADENLKGIIESEGFEYQHHDYYRENGVVGIVVSASKDIEGGHIHSGYTFIYERKNEKLVLAPPGYYPNPHTFCMGPDSPDEDGRPVPPKENEMPEFAKALMSRLHNRIIKYLATK